MKRWEDVGYVLASEVRTHLMRLLDTHQSTPTQLAELLKVSRSTVSTALKDLAKRGLVECLTPEQRKGRLYAVTALGKKITDDVMQIVRKGGI